MELFISKFSYAVSLNDSITCFAISNQSHSSQFSNVLDWRVLQQNHKLRGILLKKRKLRFHFLFPRIFSAPILIYNTFNHLLSQSFPHWRQRTLDPRSPFLHSRRIVDGYFWPNYVIVLKLKGIKKWGKGHFNVPQEFVISCVLLVRILPQELNNFIVPRRKSIFIGLKAPVFQWCF